MNFKICDECTGLGFIRQWHSWFTHARKVCPNCEGSGREVDVLVSLYDLLYRVQARKAELLAVRNTKANGNT
jgi:hypothetical protein